MLKNKTYFSRFAWAYLIYNFYVVLGGAFVRATGSGAGCGAHWPLCKGDVIPNFSFLKTIIEFTQRASSGIVSVGALILCFWAFKCFEKKTFPRTGALFVLFFIFLEAILGAALVLFSLVEKNSSNFRAVMMILHLTTTFMLLASIALTAFWSSAKYEFKINFNHKNKILIVCIILSLLLVGSTGAITALGDTLFPPQYVGEGLLSDLSFQSHILKSVRIYHPALAIVISFFVVSQCYKLNTQKNNLFIPIQNKLFYSIFTLICIQLLFGFLNIVLLTPIWTQLVHLFIADLIWVITIVFLSIIIQL